MASCRSRHGFMAILAVMAILTTTTSSVGGSSICPGDLVYPFEARCWAPARYFGEEVYKLVNQFNLPGSLAPEWDESNSTYYVRLAAVGATYKFEYGRSRELRADVSQTHDVRIVNVESGRALGWRQEGQNEWFLVEVSPGEGSDFQFATSTGSPSPPCPLIYPPWSCGVYTIRNFGTSLGLTPYVEDNTIYFKLSDVSNAFRFRLRKVNTVSPLA